MQLLNGDFFKNPQKTHYWESHSKVFPPPDSEGALLFCRRSYNSARARSHLWSVMNVACSKLIKINLSLYFAGNYYYRRWWKIGELWWTGRAAREVEVAIVGGTFWHSVKMNWWSEQTVPNRWNNGWWEWKGVASEGGDRAGGGIKLALIIYRKFETWQLRIDGCRMCVLCGLAFGKWVSWVRAPVITLTGINPGNRE